ncbi:MAG: tripartite tricarboxylate transporter substrate binding protein [Betaproteobacteria bacterium]|nr:tripartite tricarboxylate transporter substrate binding protein [Betaproteobacteria bacterium]
MHLSLRCSLLALLSLSSVYAASVAAQGYPAKPIRIIVPYAPGGSTDVVFRILAPRLTEFLGQQVLVENRPGAASTIGLDLVAKSAPDGYTVGVANIAYGANPTLYKKMPFDAEKDLVPVSLVSIVTMVLSVHPSVPARSVKQLIALARAKPESLVYGSAGNGSANHLATARFAHMTGTKLVHVPYKGGGPAVVSIVSGETAVLFATIPSAIQHFKSGRLVPLGVSRAQRNSALPDIPTVAEAGVPGYEAIEWNGMMVPTGTPAAVINRLHQALVKATAIPEVKERITGLGADLVGNSPAEFGAFLKNELATWSKVVKEVGMRID